MNNQFNYAMFVDLFLESDQEHEPYAVAQEASPQPSAAMEPEYNNNKFSSPS